MVQRLFRLSHGEMKSERGKRGQKPAILWRDVCNLSRQQRVLSCVPLRQFLSQLEVKEKDILSAVHEVQLPCGDLFQEILELP